jgi:hypothetical protein
MKYPGVLEVFELQSFIELYETTVIIPIALEEFGKLLPGQPAYLGHWNPPMVFNELSELQIEFFT